MNPWIFLLGAVEILGGAVMGAAIWRRGYRAGRAVKVEIVIKDASSFAADQLREALMEAARRDDLL